MSKIKENTRGKMITARGVTGMPKSTVLNKEFPVSKRFDLLYHKNGVFCGITNL